MIGFIVNYALVGEKIKTTLSGQGFIFSLWFPSINCLVRYQKHFGEHMKLSEIGFLLEIYSEKNKELGGKMNFETAPETELEYSMFSWIETYNTKKTMKIN